MIEFMKHQNKICFQIEKSGYVMSIQSDSRMMSLKRRWCVLRNGRLMFYKTAGDEQDGAQPVHALPIVDVDGVTKMDAGAGRMCMCRK